VWQKLSRRRRKSKVKPTTDRSRRTALNRPRRSICQPPADLHLLLTTGAHYEPFHPISTIGAHLLVVSLSTTIPIRDCSI
jgi:hypothetical protein